ncbi:MAG: hypothetical protein QXT84_04140 [Candidatus Bathyarchaeia archaeon]
MTYDLIPMHYLNVTLEDTLWDALQEAKNKYNCNSWAELFQLMLKNMEHK